MESIDRVKIIEEIGEGKRELTTLSVVFCVIQACSTALSLHPGCAEIAKATLSTEALIKDRIQAIKVEIESKAEEFQKATEFILEKPVTNNLQ